MKRWQVRGSDGREAKLVLARYVQERVDRTALAMRVNEVEVEYSGCWFGMDVSGSW